MTDISIIIGVMEWMIQTVIYKEGLIATDSDPNNNLTGVESAYSPELKTAIDVYYELCKEIGKEPIV